MFVIRNLSLLPNRKVIVDIAQSNAAANKDSYSPYHGAQTQFIRFFGHHLDTTTGNIYNMLSSKDDFDADKVKPKYTEEEFDGEDCLLENDGVDYDPAKHSLQHSYNRRLEDIAQAFIVKYIENLAYSIVRYDSGGIREYNAKHITQPTFVSSDDSEDITEFADLITFSPVRSYSSDVVTDANKRLPYVLKRLHALSKLCGIHMPTYVASYYRAYNKNVDARLRKTTTASLRPNHVIAEGVYTCDGRGEIHKKVEIKYKNQKALRMFAWLMGEVHDWDSYKKDVYDFIHYCEILNIDLMSEDMLKYPASFYDNLTVLCVTPNNRYSEMIKQALRKNLSAETPEESAPVNVIPEIIKTFQEATLTNESLKSWVNNFKDSDASAIMNNYQGIIMIHNNQYKLNQYSPRDYYYEDGLLMARGRLVQISANWLCEWSNMNTQVVFHELGYVIVCVPGSTLTVLQSNEALENAKKHLGIPTELKVAWRKLLV